MLKDGNLVCVLDGLSTDFLTLSLPEKTIEALRHAYPDIIFSLGEPYDYSKKRTPNSDRRTA